MKTKYVMDRGLRIIGGIVLITLPFIVSGIETAGRITALFIGVYALTTGIMNICPLYYFILREKSGKRKKLSAENFLQIKNLKELLFFKGMNEEEVGLILACSVLKEYPEGSTVVREGDFQKKISIIFSGQFKIVKLISADEHKIITIMGDGETYGEMSFFDDSPPCCSVISMENSKVLEIGEQDFNEMIKENPTLGIKILNRLMHISSARIRALNKQIASLGIWVLEGRQRLQMSVA